MVVPAEAEAVHTIFACYLELGSVRALADELEPAKDSQQAAIDRRSNHLCRGPETCARDQSFR